MVHILDMDWIETVLDAAERAGVDARRSVFDGVDVAGTVYLDADRALLAVHEAAELVPAVV